MNPFESWWYNPDAITGTSMFDLHGIPTSLHRLCFKAGEFSVSQREYSSKLKSEVISKEGAHIKVTRINLKKPICSADGCSLTEPCGPYCRDRGNFK